MNKRYMDFVPKGAAKKPVHRPAAGIRQEDFAEVNELDVSQLFEAREKVVQAGVTKPKTALRTPKVEDYRAKFVQTEVNKRPLSVKPRAVTKPVDGMAKLSSAAKKPVATVKKPVAAVATKKPAATTTGVSAKKQALPVKKSFVNTEKVAKRPLSKNVYRKNVMVPKETPSGPVTIIDKPEKDSKVGLVVTIIITIILGAAAGTVAFLLLPK